MRVFILQLKLPRSFFKRAAENTLTLYSHIAKFPYLKTFTPKIISKVLLNSMYLHKKCSSYPKVSTIPTIIINKQSKFTNPQKGFTLIEVMVALAILALVSVVASQTSLSHLKAVENLKTRTLAHFVAQNTAANLQINPLWPVPTQVNQVSAQGRTWQVSMTPIAISKAFKTSGLDSNSVQDTIQPVSIQVAPIDSETSEVQHVITDLTVVVSQSEEVL